jgi:DNA-binding transcriptional ArsR family regulator
VGAVTEQEAADVAKAIAHPTRLAMVRMLRDTDDGLSASFFSRKCPGHGTLSKLNYHITELKKAGVTTTEPVPGSRGWKRNLHRLTPDLGALAVKLVNDIDAARMPS